MLDEVQRVSAPAADWLVELAEAITPGTRVVVASRGRSRVKGDNTVEPNEAFFVNLSNPTGATNADGQGLGTITTTTDAREVPQRSGGLIIDGSLDGLPGLLHMP